MGRSRFELFLPRPMAVGVALSGGAVSVSAWALRAAPAGGAVPPAPSDETGGGENSGLSG